MKHDQTKLGVLFLLAILFIMTLSSGRKAYAETNTSEQCTIRQSDGSSCTMSLEVVSEPAFASGAKVAENGEISFTFSVVGSSYYLPTSIPTPVRRSLNPGNNPVWEDRPQDFVPPEPPVQ
ncbi:MAG: hypothetical protein AB9907_01955 [Flexilinea sp.]